MDAGAILKLEIRANLASLLPYKVFVTTCIAGYGGGVIIGAVVIALRAFSLMGDAVPEAAVRIPREPSI